MSFPEAVRHRGAEVDIPLPKREYSSPEEAAEARLRRKLLDLHETATAWFEERLRGPKERAASTWPARPHPEGIKTFRIGYAPDSFNALRDRLSGDGRRRNPSPQRPLQPEGAGDGTHWPIYDRSASASCFPSPMRAAA